MLAFTNTPPTANFTYSPQYPTIYDTVTFTDLSYDSDGSIVNYTWNFGDGNISYEQNPMHQYANSETYNVTLTVKDNSSATDSISQFIKVCNGSWNYWDNSPNMWSIPDGNVGIGTTTPETKLDVNGSFRVRSTSITDLFFVDTSTNKIGIGTNNPLYPLDIKGKFRVKDTTGSVACIIDGNPNSQLMFRSNGNDRFSLIWIEANGKFSFRDLQTNKPIFDLIHNEGIVINEGAYNYDFRVESMSNSHMLFVDASTNNVGINTDKIQTSKKHLQISHFMRHFSDNFHQLR